MKLFPFQGLKDIKTRRWIEMGVIAGLLLILLFVSQGKQTESHYIPLKRLEITHIHDMQYNRSESKFTVKGEDPSFVLGEKNRNIAVSDLTGIFSSLSDPEAYIVHYIPFDRKEAAFSENWKVTPEIEKTNDGIRLHWHFPQEVVRIRMSPSTAESFILKGIEAGYHRVSPERINIIWFVLIIVILYVAARLLWLQINGGFNWCKKDTAFWLGVIFCISAKIWLVQGQELAAYVGAAHDDHLFIRLAHSILTGSWLGSYNELTLIKGPMYPIWIAASFIVGVPLLLGQHLFYIAACLYFIYLFKKKISSKAILLLILLFLLFNPGTYDISQARVLRSSIYTSFSLWICVVLFAIYQSRSDDLRRTVTLCIWLGLLLSAFWLTREEGIWIIPSIVLVFCFTVYQLVSERNCDCWKRVLVVCLLPTGVWCGILLTVSTMNYMKYGIFCTVEFKTKPFKNAYGALNRVSPDRFLPYVPVPRETRKEIYEVSPSLAELKPFLEGNVGKGWASHGAFLTGLDPTELEIAGGWFMWALRDAAAQAGFHASGEKAMDFYSRISREINAACDKGVLHCLPERSTMAPPLRSDHFIVFLNRYIQELLNTASFRHVQVGRIYSMVPPEDRSNRPFADFEDLTLENLAPIWNQSLDLLIQSRVNQIKIEVLRDIFEFYKAVMPFIFVFSIVIFIFSVVYRLYLRGLSFLAVFNTALLGAVVARLGILMYIDITSFPAVNSQYLAPSYPLILLFCATSIMDGYTVCESVRNGKKEIEQAEAEKEIVSHPIPSRMIK